MVSFGYFNVTTMLTTRRHILLLCNTDQAALDDVFKFLHKTVVA